MILIGPDVNETSQWSPRWRCSGGLSRGPKSSWSHTLSYKRVVSEHPAPTRKAANVTLNTVWYSVCTAPHWPKPICSEDSMQDYSKRIESLALVLTGGAAAVNYPAYQFLQWMHRWGKRAKSFCHRPALLPTSGIRRTYNLLQWVDTKLWLRAIQGRRWYDWPKFVICEIRNSPLRKRLRVIFMHLILS